MAFACDQLPWHRALWNEQEECALVGISNRTLGWLLGWRWLDVLLKSRMVEPLCELGGCA